MDGIPAPPMERRLQTRFFKLVRAHMHHSPSGAPGPKANAESVRGLSATQAAWRFLNNDRVTLQALAQPLLEAGRRAAADSPATLLVHDWSKLKYAGHGAKSDLAQLTHERDVGYELSTALLLSAADGSPLAPMQMHLKTAAATHSTCPTPPTGDEPHLHQVLATMRASATWGLPCRPVHVIDREADSVYHYRQWDQAGHRFLVRADDRRVQWQGQTQLLSQIAASLVQDQALEDVRAVACRGKRARQHVAQSTVTLHRPAKTRGNGRQREVPGPPLDLRLVVSQVRDGQGRVLAQWLLLTNVPEDEAAAGTVALWYYWRWRIESFFKLLKSGGHQIEHWQQETGLAIARRLLVASMACVVVWQLQRRQDDEAQQLKTLLVNLSGRAMKRSRPCTDSAVLAGLFVLLPLLDLLQTHAGNLEDLRRLATQTLPILDGG